MKQIIKRKSRMFCIDKTQLKPEARTTEVYNGLYAALYEEFKGANESPKYKRMTPLERLNSLNVFAINWLIERGLE